MGLLGLVPPYCALVKYIGFADLDVIVFRKLYVFYNGDELAPVSPINVKVATVTEFFFSIINSPLIRDWYFFHTAYTISFSKINRLYCLKKALMTKNNVSYISGYPTHFQHL